MRALVCGGRDFRDYALLGRTLTAIGGITCIVHGAARGADSLAASWGYRNKIPCIPKPADWDAHGRGAGIIRNMTMLQETKPDLVVAFPGGTGTANMVQIARAAGVDVIQWWMIPRFFSI